MKEFNLNSKRFISKCGWDVIQTNEIKEFIKRLKKNLKKGFKYCYLDNCMEKEIDKISGDLK